MASEDPLASSWVLLERPSGPHDGPPQGAEPAVSSGDAPGPAPGGGALPGVARQPASVHGAIPGTPCAPLAAGAEPQAAGEAVREEAAPEAGEAAESPEELPESAPAAATPGGVGEDEAARRAGWRSKLTFIEALQRQVPVSLFTVAVFSLSISVIFAAGFVLHRWQRPASSCAAISSAASSTPASGTCRNSVAEARA
mmetsp:Transcript_18794/g.54735  ORF Transcript_18794/g.54735 Transcript_18794/m.54735 type:complete len:198 (-) Transcript_18794:317-910(-)